MTCSNCNARLSCGCQRKTASDGTACCSSCIAFYEKGLISKKEITPTTSKSILPAQKNVWGTNRYVNTIKK